MSEAKRQGERRDDSEHRAVDLVEVDRVDYTGLITLSDAVDGWLEGGCIGLGHLSGKERKVENKKSMCWYYLLL